jgi:hypothetical protein
MFEKLIRTSALTTLVFMLVSLALVGAALLGHSQADQHGQASLETETLAFGEIPDDCKSDVICGPKVALVRTIKTVGNAAAGSH